LHVVLAGALLTCGDAAAQSGSAPANAPTTGAPTNAPANAPAAAPAAAIGTGGTRQQLQDAERARAASLAAQRDAVARAAAAVEAEKRLAASRTEAAAALHTAEAATLAVAHRIDDLARTRQDAEDRLQARAADLAPLLPVVERLSLYPTETLLAAPGSTEDAVRGLLVLNGLSRRIEVDAEALRQARADTAQASQRLESEMSRLAEAEAAQAAQARDLDQQLATAEADRREAVDTAATAARHAAEEASQAQTLRAVLASLDAEHRAAERRAKADEARAERRHQSAEADEARQREKALDAPAATASLPSDAAARGQLTAPVAGTILRGWGAASDAGPTTGILYRAPPAARVVAMCGGRVVFAAPFRSYGLLLIVDCGGGYHAVTAGYQALDAKVGQLVRAGEPVGTMPSWNPGQAGTRPALYVELRRDGQPIDPAPWLKANG
jgi:septal ring factor EnvC (AmiA/AmiB activator)